MKRSTEEINNILTEKYFLEEKDDRYIGRRKCPECNEFIFQSSASKSILLRNIQICETRVCKSCVKKEGRNHFFGKTHSKKAKQKISKNRIGKACGKKNAMSNPKYRKKVSLALKEKYDSGELDFLKEIQSKTAKENQSNGKLSTAPISKAEIEIKEKLEFIGFEVESQYHIGSLRYDLFVKEKNLLIEYNGDYWHCNPEKFEPEYFHKKKSMTAKEIWERDQKKKELAFSEGFNYVVIWEKDFKKDKNKEINKALL